MSSNWKKVKLSTLCERIGDGLHGTPQYSETSNIFFINGNNIKNGKILYDNETKKVDTKELEKKFIKLNKNSLLISINGTLGNMAFYKGENIMLGKSAAYLNFKTNINQFYYYYFQLPNIQKYFYDVATGSTIKNLSLKSLQDFEVPIPDNNEYQKIASVLSALDDKIELNNRINAELEAMAKTLYDYWFVQFDFPNEEAKPYKSSGGKMVYNETLKREIPEGWEVKKMSFFEMYQPQTISEKELNNNLKYYVFGANGIIGKYDKFNHLDSEIVVTCRGNSCGNIIRTLPESWITGNAMVIKSIEEFIESEFIFQMLNWIGIKKVITGSGQPQITRVNLETLDFVLPKKNILSQFNELVRPIVEKKLQLFKQNQELSALRDWLLPMLMNGQVKVG